LESRSFGVEKAFEFFQIVISMNINQTFEYDENHILKQNIPCNENIFN
jgi:hypothetical protein